MPRLGRNTEIWIGGYKLSPQLVSVEAGNQGNPVEANGYTQDHGSLNTRQDGTITTQGNFDAATIHTALFVIVSGTAKIVSVAHGNGSLPVIGADVDVLAAQQINYQPTPELDGLITVAAEFKGLGSVVEFQTLLANGTITTTGNQPGFDGLASSSNGLVAVLQVENAAPTETNTVKLQSSPDDIVYADIPGAVFTLDGSVIGAERITTLSTEFVDQFVRVVDTTTGVDTFSRSVSFLRL